MEEIDMRQLLLEMAHNSRRMGNTWVHIDGVRYDFYELLRNHLFPENVKAKVSYEL